MMSQRNSCEIENWTWNEELLLEIIIINVILDGYNF